jgi:hypothetical protein
MAPGTTQPHVSPIGASAVFWGGKCGGNVVGSRAGGHPEKEENAEANAKKGATDLGAGKKHSLAAA